MKTELGLSQDLNASDAVVAGAELLGVTFESLDGKSVTLKQRVAILCREAVSWHHRHRLLGACLLGFLYGHYPRCCLSSCLQGIDLGWDQTAAQPAGPSVVSPSTILRPVAEDDDDDDDPDGGGANTAAALARLVPILGSLSDGYSGADIKMLCRDAAMAPMRRAIAGKSPDDIRRMKESGEVCLEYYRPQLYTEVLFLLQLVPLPLMLRVGFVPQLESLKLGLADFQNALGRIQPSVSAADSAQYEKWSAEFGST